MWGGWHRDGLVGLTSGTANKSRRAVKNDSSRSDKGNSYLVIEPSIGGGRGEICLLETLTRGGKYRRDNNNTHIKTRHPQPSRDFPGQGEFLRGSMRVAL